jgi:hypothetical protein
MKCTDCETGYAILNEKCAACFKAVTPVRIRVDSLFNRTYIDAGYDFRFPASKRVY